MVFLFAVSPVFAQPGATGTEFAAVWRASGNGKSSTGLPTALRDVRIEQKLDQQLPLDLVFRDESGSQ